MAINAPPNMRHAWITSVQMTALMPPSAAYRQVTTVSATIATR